MVNSYYARNKNPNNYRAGPIIGETLVETFSMLRCAIKTNSSEVALLVLFAAVDAAVTIAISVEVLNVMK